MKKPQPESQNTENETDSPLVARAHDHVKSHSLGSNPTKCRIENTQNSTIYTVIDYQVNLFLEGLSGCEG
jgi:hypothetical protein